MCSKHIAIITLKTIKMCPKKEFLVRTSYFFRKVKLTEFCSSMARSRIWLRKVSKIMLYGWAKSLLANQKIILEFQWPIRRSVHLKTGLRLTRSWSAPAFRSSLWIVSWSPGGNSSIVRGLPIPS